MTIRKLHQKSWPHIAGLSANEKRSALGHARLPRPVCTCLDQSRARPTQVPAKDLSADLVRQLHNLKDESIDKMIGDVWGQVRNTPADKAALIASYRKLLGGYQPEIGPNVGPCRIRQNVPAVSHPLRRWLEHRARPDRLQSGRC